MSYYEDHGITEDELTRSAQHLDTHARLNILRSNIAARRARDALDGDLRSDLGSDLGAHISDNLMAAMDKSTRRPLPEHFVDNLERIPKSELKAHDECPICTTRCLDDPYPLVVELPCPGRHRFDLQCISAWLADNSTCPVCRYNFAARKEVDTDEAYRTVEEVYASVEEEFDDMYG